MLAIVGLSVLLTVAALLLTNKAPPALPSTPEPSAAPPVLHVEQRFSGLVMDEGNRPLQGVDVSLPLLGLEVQTDKFGSFQFSGAYAEASDVRLSARKAGYQDYSAYGSWGNTQFTFIMSKDTGG